MKIYKVLLLGQNDEKGEQSENKEFRKKCFIHGGEIDVQLKLKLDEQITSFAAWSELQEG